MNNFLQKENKYQQLIKENTLYALIDCNNFYASCEELFRPDLKDKPIVVLSNNDGCIVARSKKAKELNIPMGEPEFKIRNFLKLHNVEVFSSNYALYGDISSRVMDIIQNTCPCEPYSIDEAFCVLENSFAINAQEIAKDIRNKIQKWVGITSSIGIAPTKTLAKIANHIAKKNTGIFTLDPMQQDFDTILKNFPVQDIWGIGRKQTEKLLRQNIKTAYDLKNASEDWIQKNLTITGLKTLRELHGFSCIETEFCETPKSLVCSRSFGVKIKTIEELKEAISSFTVRGAERLRQKKLVAQGLAVHIRTSKNIENSYKNTISTTFYQAHNDTRIMLHSAHALLKEIYQNGYPYMKAGIMYFGLMKENAIQKNLLSLENEENELKAEKLMQSLDIINQLYGKRTIKFGAEGIAKANWYMKQEHKSPYNPRDIHQLPIVKL